MTNAETIDRRFHDDFVLVPRKITEAMCDACHDVPIGFAGGPPHPQHIWDAMLAAAPAQPAPVVTDEMVERACAAFGSGNLTPHGRDAMRAALTAALTPLRQGHAND